jgi:hypothetical protein
MVALCDLLGENRLRSTYQRRRISSTFIIGLGHYLPQKVVSPLDVEERVWVVEWVLI